MIHPLSAGIESTKKNIPQPLVFSGCFAFVCERGDIYSHPVIVSKDFPAAFGFEFSDGGHYSPPSRPDDIKSSALPILLDSLDAELNRSSGAGRLNTSCKWVTRCAADSLDRKPKLVSPISISSSPSTLSFFATHSRCALGCSSGVTPKFGIYSLSLVGVGVGSTPALNALFFIPGTQKHPLSVNVHPALESEMPTFSANSFTTFIDASLSGFCASGLSSTVLYTRLNVAELTPTFSQNAVSVIARSAAFAISISSAVIISIGLIIATHYKQFYPKRENNLTVMGRHSNQSGLLFSYQLQTSRQKNGAEVVTTRQRRFTTELIKKDSAMTTHQDTTAQSTNQKANPPKITRRFSYFRAEIEIDPARYVARDTIIVERKGYKPKSRQWNVSFRGGFDSVIKAGNNFPCKTRDEVKLKIKELVAQHGSAAEGIGQLAAFENLVNRMEMAA